MESLKEPTMVISLTTAAALVGSSLYFYKKTQAIETELSELSDRLVSVFTKMAELQVGHEKIDTLYNHTKKISSDLSEQRKMVEECRIDIEYLLESIDLIVDSLKEIGTDITLPRKNRYSSSHDTYDHDDHPRSQRPKNDHYRERDREREPRSSRNYEDDNEEEDIQEQIKAVRGYGRRPTRGRDS